MLLGLENLLATFMVERGHVVPPAPPIRGARHDICYCGCLITGTETCCWPWHARSKTSNSTILTSLSFRTTHLKSSSVVDPTKRFARVSGRLTYSLFFPSKLRIIDGVRSRFFDPRVDLCLAGCSRFLVRLHHYRIPYPFCHAWLCLKGIIYLFGPVAIFLPTCPH